MTKYNVDLRSSFDPTKTFKQVLLIDWKKRKVTTQTTSMANGVQTITTSVSDSLTTFYAYDGKGGVELGVRYTYKNGGADGLPEHTGTCILWWESCGAGFTGFYKNTRGDTFGEMIGILEE
jgi:hypothetical protein